MPQSLAKIYIHLIFSTKHRQPLLHTDWRGELFQVIGGLVNGQGGQSLIVGGVADHVHLLFDLGRKTSIADMVRVVKSSSSAWIERDKRFVTDFGWQSGYAAFSVSQSNIPAVKTYIENQETHHLKRKYQDEIREWLRKYEMTWDETYVWD